MNSHYASLYKQASIIDISIILDHFKVKYDRSFDYLISCPIPSHIHQSNTPSFKVYKSTNSFYCFGCKASGGPVHLTKHMLGVKTLEEALDYLASNFDLKTRSLAKSFLSITKSLKTSNQNLSPELIAQEKFEHLLSFSSRIKDKASLNKIQTAKLCEFYDTFYYTRRLFVNNIFDRKTFYARCDVIFAEFETFLLDLQRCQEKDCVIDAESL